MGPRVFFLFLVFFLWMTEPALSFPAEWKEEVGKYAIYRGYRSRYRVFKGQSDAEIQRQVFTLRIAIVGMEKRKERKRHQNVQIYYWVEYDLGEGENPASYQKAKFLVHENDLKSGNFLNTAKEYMIQETDRAPLFTTLDISPDYNLLWPFRLLSPDIPVKKISIGEGKLSIQEQEYTAPLIYFEGERFSPASEIDPVSKKEKISGKTLVFEKIPFKVLQLEETIEEEIIYKVPSRTVGESTHFVTSFSVRLVDSGDNARSWIEGEPIDLRVPK